MKLIKRKRYVIKYIDNECKDSSFIGIAYYLGKDGNDLLFSEHCKNDEFNTMCFNREHIIKEYKGEETHLLDKKEKCWVIGQSPVNNKNIVIATMDSMGIKYFPVLKSRVKLAL